MMHNIDINKMNRLMEENKEAKQIISQLLENHQVTVSTIAHEIRNPLTLVSSALQIIQVQHPEVKEFSHWKQTMDDIDFMRQLLEELSTFNNGNTLHYSVFSIEHLLKNIAISFAISLDKEYRGKGIGTELMKRMLGLLKAQGYTKSSLAVQKTNTAAVKMYGRVGFETVSEKESEYIMLCRL